MENLSLILKWAGSCDAAYHEEPSTFLHETGGDVVEIDENDCQVLAGRFHLYYVDADGALNAGMSLYDVMDMEQTTFDYYQALFEVRTYFYNRAVLDLLQDDVIESNLLILDRLELLPRYRGAGHGLQVICEMIRRFGPGAGVVAMKPYPLQFELRALSKELSPWQVQMGMDRLSKSQREATTKLRDYYARLGFARVKRTPYMVRAGAAPLPGLGMGVEDIAGS